MHKAPIRGSLVAIVTPMHDEGELDLERFRALIDFHVAEGTDGIVVAAQPASLQRWISMSITC